MRFGLLGPLLVEDGTGVARSVTGARQRILLATLLTRANCVVPVRELAEIVWNGAPPPAALPTQVMRLRRTLGDQVGARIVTRNPGYVITMDDEELDANLFEALYRNAGAAVRAGQWSETMDAASLALDLWRGEALADVDSPVLRQEHAGRWDQLLLQTVEWRMEAEMHLGHHDRLVPELRDLAQRHPLREHVHAQLMLALYRCGRQAEALDAYRYARRILAEDLGVEPGLPLRELHQQILAGDAALLAPAPGPDAGNAAATHNPAVVPQQLPASSPHFTGRADALTTLTDLAKQAAESRSTVSISAIDGMAGIGKTALAVHAAHRLADQFPDGVLFTDLRGFTPEVDPTPPEQVLDQLLRGLGVPGPQIPPDLQSRVGLYRSTLAGRRVLIVLDNAVHETQLAPLLPAAAGCAAIITSRRHLAGLDDATHLTLPSLDSTEAASLFRSVAGDRATASDQPVIERIVALCGYLPLAIRIAAARLRLAPAGTPAMLCAELADALDTEQGLEWLSDGHRTVEAALAMSYRHLNTKQRHVFQLAGLHPGPTIEAYSVAALSNISVTDARRLLQDLYAASLINQPVHRRYALHDLVAAYATKLADDLPEPERHTALGRLYDHYAATSSRATNLIHPWEIAERPAPPATNTPAPTLSTSEEAQDWLDTETDNLLATAHQAPAHCRADYTRHQSATLRRHLRSRGRYGQAIPLHQRALAYARQIDDYIAESDALTGLGIVHRLQGRYAEAADYLEQASVSARQSGNHYSEQEALLGLGAVHWVQGQYGLAADCYQQALDSARRTGNRSAEQHALCGLGHVHYPQGRYDNAIGCFDQALESASSTGNDHVEQEAARGLGTVHYLQGRHGLAADCYQRALDSARRTGSRSAEQDALRGLGIVLYAQRRYGPAANCLQQALDSARQVGNRSAEQETLIGLGNIHCAQGRPRAAADCFEQLLAITHETDNRNVQFEAHRGLGRVRHATNNHHDALHHNQTALRLATELDQPADQARAHDGLAHAHHALNSPDQARHHWQTALDLLTSIGADHTEEPNVTTEAIRTRLLHLTNPPTHG